jgi:O-antigen/teichoic acid export membrane protein
VLVLAALAQAVNGALFWNVGVLYVSGRSNLVARVALAGAATQLLLLPPLVATLDADGAALSYLVSTLGTNLVALYWAGAVLRRTNGEAAPRHQPGPELTAPREI